MLVTLYTSRVILNTLGVEDYGIYNVVGGVVSLLSVFSSAMSTATQRFLSFEIGKGDFVQLKKTFNAAHIIHIGIALFVFILAETVGLWFVKNYLVIPNERMNAAIWVYHFSILSFMISIIQVPYNATIIAHERMSVYAYLSVFEVILKLLIVFMLTWISYDKLKLYGILYLSVTILITSSYRIYTLLNFKESKFELVKDKKLYITLISYSGWNLIGNLAAVVKGQGINLLLNLFFGPVINAARGIATQVQIAVHSFVSNFQMAVNPQIVKSYAIDDRDYMNTLIISSAKFSFYLLSLLSLPIILEVKQILILWLKIVPDYANIFTILSLILILITSVSGPLITALLATGNIKTYQTVVGILLIMILPISYVLLKVGYPPHVTLYVAFIIEIIALFMRLLFLKRMIKFPVLKFIKEVLVRNLLIILLSLSLPLFIRSTMEENIFRLIAIVSVSVIWTAVVIIFVGLNKSERKLILTIINKVFKREAAE
jgi:O-antigen/teichoic acid export membrane protein